MIRLNFSKLMMLLSIIVLNGITFREAFAYIDPGSGSMVIQLVIAALVGAGIAVKVFWEKLKYRFSLIFKK